MSVEDGCVCKEFDVLVGGCEISNLFFSNVSVVC